MEDGIIARMQAEEAELARKLEAVRAFLAAYGAPIDRDDVVGPAKPLEAHQGLAKAPTAGARPKVEIDGFGDYGRRIIAECMKAMLLTGSTPLKTRTLVHHLETKQIEITGENKINAVGALLSRSLDITSHGKAGWTVKDPHRALEIVGKYAPEENEAPGNPFEEPGASDAGWGSAATPIHSIGSPSNWRSS